jgi:hypothetical protein
LNSGPYACKVGTLTFWTTLSALFLWWDFLR